VSGTTEQAAAVEAAGGERSGTALGRTVVLGTRSGGKVRELGALLDAAGIVWCPLASLGLAEDELVEAALETGDTFEANALAKGRHFHALTGGRPVLAEDSGLCVDALGGAPGVYSKRWGARPGLSGAALDAANNQRLLSALTGATTRAASFECAAVLVWSGGTITGRGRTTGRVLEAPGGRGGFGYDPLFWSDELAACFGAVSRERKASVSHRGRAVRAVLAAWAQEVARAR
jgi:XTP/dITP diphosphohydrolase